MPNPSKYSKLFGTIIGAAVPIGAIFGLDFSWMQSPEVQTAMVMIGSMIGTYFFPKNAE